MRFLSTLVMALAIVAAPQSPNPTSVKETSLTGCLDQREQTYVLSSGADMSTVTKLKGKSFSDDNFARYVGKKVTVSGAMEGDTLQVRKIEQVADTCSP